MLTFLGAVLRALIGFVAACLAAGFVQVLFAVTPAELVVAGDDRLGEAMTWGLLSATQIAVFAAPFAALAALISEWQGIRSFAYHAIVAMAISVAGFGLIYATEAPNEASIVNSYAMAAYLTSGFVGGLVYWIFAGRWATRLSQGYVRMESDRRSPDRDRGRDGSHDSARDDATSRSSTDASRKDQHTINERMAALRSTGTVPVTKPTEPLRDDTSEPVKTGGSSSD